MHCNYCNEPLAPGASFCAKCGRSTKTNMNSGAPGIVCPNCRAVSPTGTLFCVGCGSALTAQQRNQSMASNPQQAQPRMQVPAGYPATGAPLPPQGVKKGKAGVFLILLPLIALLIGILAAVAQAGGFSSEASQEIPQGIEVLSIDPASMPSFQPVDGDDSVQESDGGAGVYESTQGHFSGELLDPYNVRSFWGNSHDIDSFASIMGLSYNSSETERLRRQVDFELDVYTGPFGHVLPATDKAECYAYVTPGGNVFRFDYKYYVSASASPQEVADTYYAAVDAMDTMGDKTKDLESYSGVRDGFTYDEIVEHVAAGMEEYSFQTGFGTTANPDDCTSVMLLQRDGVLSLIMQWTLPLDESASSQSVSPPSESSSSSGNSPSSSGNTAFDISLGGIMEPDAADPRYDPSEGYILQISDFEVIPNGSGGYDCYITFINPSSYDTKFGIDAWLYGGYEEADIIPLAQSYWIHNDGSAETFYFEINDPPANGMWEVWFDCRLW